MRSEKNVNAQRRRERAERASDQNEKEDSTSSPCLGER